MAATLFLCYVQQDASFLESLEKHLSALLNSGMITIWHRHKIIAGSDWEHEVNQHLNTSSLILLLVSPHFLASEYQYGVEFQRAMQRHEEHKARVIPILLRSCDWQGTPLGKLQILPHNEKPLEMRRYRDEGFAEVVKEIRRVLEAPQTPIISLPGSSQPLWNVPYRRNLHFTGRDEIFLQLDQHLALPSSSAAVRPQCVALTQPYALTGLGGIGKTQIAVEYAYRSREVGRYRHTFWINAASEEAILTSFAELAEILPAFPASGEIDQHKLAQAVKRWLEQYEDPWLLICDNADEPALLDAYLPRQGKGCVLLTTRAHAVGSLAAAVEVETMGLIEGTHLLLRRAQRLDHASDEEINEAGTLVVVLDHFPLALEQAGAYLEETQCSYAEYLDLYRTHRHALLARRGQQATDYPDSVATTWALSFQKVQQADPAAGELLALCAFLAPDRIPEELLKEAATCWPALLEQAVADPLRFNRLLERLLKYSLVKRLTADRMLSIHRLVQVVQKETMKQEEQRHWEERVIRAVNQVFPADPAKYTEWPYCRRHLDQVQQCFAFLEHTPAPPVEAGEVLDRAALYLNTQGLCELATPLQERALVIREQHLRKSYAASAGSSNNLALLYQQQGKYAEAEQLFKRALATCELELGATHLDTAANLNNLAGLYVDQGKYAEAEPLYLRTLAIFEQQLGATHPDTARSLSNLASLYRTQGKYAEAEPLFKRALAIREQVLGATHLDTASNLNNLAMLYQEQGKYAEAEPLHQQALAIYEQVLEASHPNMAMSFNNLALLYQEQGKYTEAEPLFKRALAIREQVSGTGHPDTATCLNNLATLYQLQGKYTEAEPLFERALAIYEQVSGTGHANTAGSLNNLALNYRAQGKYAKAEPLLKRALAIRERQLGATHLDTADSLSNLALLYQEQRKYAEAEPLYQRALAIYEQELGQDHSQMAKVLSGLASLYQEQRKYAEAEPLFKRALAIREQELGATHLDTADSLDSLAQLYQEQARSAEAEPLLKRVLAIREQVLGASHFDTAASLNSLGVLYRTQGKYAEAEPLLKRALAIYEQVLGTDHPNMATGLNNLALLYRVQEKYIEAEPLFKRALAIYEQRLGATHLDTARSLSNLAGLYVDQRKYAEAEPLYQQALAIRERQLGNTHPDTARSLSNLAVSYSGQGRYGEAEPLIKRALAISEQVLGTHHPQTALRLQNLAELYSAQRRYKEAESLFQRVLAVYEQVLGRAHPNTQTARKSYVNLLRAMGREAAARELEGVRDGSREPSLRFNRIETREVTKATAALFNEALSAVPAIAPHAIMAAYKDLKNVWGSQALYSGTPTQMREIVSHNLGLLARRSKFATFIIDTMKDDQCAQVNVLYEETFIGIRLWRSPDRIFVCGNADFEGPQEAKAERGPEGPGPKGPVKRHVGFLPFAESEIEALVKRHVMRLRAQLADGIPASQWHLLMRSDILDFTIHSIARQVPLSRPEDTHKYWGQSFSDAIVVVSVVPTFSPSQAMTYFPRGYAKTLLALMNEYQYDLEGSSPFIHWIYCFDSNDHMIHLSFHFPKASQIRTLVIAQDLLSREEKTQILGE